MQLELTNLIYQFVVLSLVILFFISFVRFIYTLLTTQKKSVEHGANIEKKLDRIIELLEKNRTHQ
ncbi:DUF4083 family protein [Lihuaxuella thermophila]|uniref:DUF4083 domain-containing protein n=1 Tax=Lihuaxuella thermophila TaxID=1173111 RepID=A0A1H8CJ57_9BACL|nr:DUF4083 family protein [Lihuaxuella thermophila]SEM94454.1 protein of unknown function [Lihuaxuella thermophila]